MVCYLHNSTHISKVELVVRARRRRQQVLACLSVDLQGGRDHAGGSFGHAALEFLTSKVPLDDGVEDADECGTFELYQAEQTEVAEQPEECPRERVENSAQ